MQNRTFQWLWYKIVMRLVSKDPLDPQNPIAAYGPRFERLLRMANFFGCAWAVWLGDSNCERANEFSIMKKFDKITLNFGKGGTTAHDWLTFFSTDFGKGIYDQIKDKIVILNIGGNYVLKNEMKLAKDGLKEIHTLFPESINATIPPVYTEILDNLDNTMPGNRTLDEWNRDVKKLNDIIKKEWEERTLDLYTIFYDQERAKVFWWALQDMVHFSKKAISLYASIVNMIINKLGSL